MVAIVAFEAVADFGFEFGGGEVFLAEVDELGEGGVVWGVFEVLRVAVEPYMEGGNEGSIIKEKIDRN